MNEDDADDMHISEPSASKVLNIKVSVGFIVLGFLILETIRIRALLRLGY